MRGRKEADNIRIGHQIGISIYQREASIHENIHISYQ